jgi:hypothetical protein
LAAFIQAKLTLPQISERNFAAFINFEDSHLPTKTLTSPLPKTYIQLGGMMKAFKAAMVALGVFGAHFANAGFVDSSNRDWLQLTNTYAINTQTFLGVCDPTNGVCAGNVTDRVSRQALSLTGYTWATMAEVRGLFASNGVISTRTGNGFGAGTTQNTTFSAAVGAAWVDLDGAGADTGAFDCTTCSATAAFIEGLARPEAIGTFFGAPELRFTFSKGIVSDRYELDSPIAIASTTNPGSIAAGYWLYKPGTVVVSPPTPPAPGPVLPPAPIINEPVNASVPVPSTLVMVLLGALGAFFSRRRLS